MSDNPGSINFPNPIPSFKFHVEMDGIIEGQFLECSGLGAKRKTFQYKEGGVNEYVHQLPDRLTYTNVKFKRGIASPKLFEWFLEGQLDGKVRYSNISIIVFGYGDGGVDVVRQWDLERCYPIKWTGPALKTDSKNAAIETLEVAHHGLTIAR